MTGIRAFEDFQPGEADSEENWRHAFNVIWRKKMDFSEALIQVKHGKRIMRTGWNGKGLCVELQVPDANSKMTLPYLYLNYPEDAKNTPGARVPWLASQTDILADDWAVVG